MSRYDGLIIPRSYSEYINKTDAATLQQALQLPGVLSAIVAAGDNKAVKSSAIYEALNNYINKTDADTLQQALQLPGVLSGAVAAGDNKAVKSSAVNAALSNYRGVLEKIVTINHGNDVHTLVTLETNSTYLLHASGNNYGGYLGFVTNGYNSRTVINELYHSSISAVVSGFKTLDFKSFVDGDILLSIVRF